MKRLDGSVVDLEPDRIVGAVRAVVPARDVTVTPIDDPHGALVEACCVDVYLMVAPERDSFTVSCWQSHSTEPYLTLSAATLDEAVQYVRAEFDNL